MLFNFPRGTTWHPVFARQPSAPRGSHSVHCYQPFQHRLSNQQRSYSYPRHIGIIIGDTSQKHYYTQQSWIVTAVVPEPFTSPRCRIRREAASNNHTMLKDAAVVSIFFLHARNGAECVPLLLPCSVIPVLGSSRYRTALVRMYGCPSDVCIPRRTPDSKQISHSECEGS